jgi:hypothetical protein
MYTILPFSGINPTDWDTLVASSPDGFAWATTAWRQVILGVERWQLEDHSFALTEDSRLLAVMPLQYCPPIRVMSSTGWGSSGPVVSAGLGIKHRKKVLTQMFEHAENLARQCGAVEFSFGVPPVNQISINAPWGVNPYLDYGFEERSGVTRILDLSLDVEILWKDLSEIARRTINRARHTGYTVERGDWQAEVDTYYACHVETYTRTGVPPHPKAYFEGIADCSTPKGMSVLWVCRDAGGKAVAFHNSALFTGSGMYHTGCSASDAIEEGVNYLLFWEVMCGLKDMGIRWYECGEVCPNTTQESFGKNKLFGTAVFKSKFGGENHRYFRCFKRLVQEEKKEVVSRKAALLAFLSAGKFFLSTIIGSRATGIISRYLWKMYRIFTGFRNRAK